MTKEFRLLRHEAIRVLSYAVPAIFGWTLFIWGYTSGSLGLCIAYLAVGVIYGRVGSWRRKPGFSDVWSSLWWLLEPTMGLVLCWSDFFRGKTLLQWMREPA